MNPDISPAIKIEDQGIIVTIEVSTGCGGDQFPAGYNSWRKSIGCHTTAHPNEGRANRAIVRLISDVCSVSRSQVRIISGHTSSLKRVRITGRSAEEISKIIRDLLKDHTK
jgi:uncharacterized protein (TIGR00251 family)